ncbi:putative SLACS reverse transcriptase [Trypanosoma cruzi]|uniref:Putative SLACS reverse transcriptase n=1 Tax=Trypanosoma cruzi TaxID=5693 RepID=A0A2V2UUG0_TRYCR|nr:putative SLACS reverse transcriptase [Trypanosoma cruzi]
MDGPVTKRARDIAALPVRRGGCGLRRQKEIAEFAYACLGEKGKQHALTDELDAKHQSDLYETLQGPDRKVFVSNTAAGAGRPLTDPQVHADDRGFSTYLRERLLVRVLPEGQKCVCGADASNEHVHTCTRLQQNPRTTRPRHDQHDVRKRVATMRIPMRHGTAPDGGEPAATGHPHRGTRHVRDHRRDRHIRRAGDGICVRGVHGGGRPTTRCTGPPHAKATKVPSLGTGQRAGL